MKEALRQANVDTSEVCRLIDRWIFNERDRAMLKRRLVDGIRFEALSEEFGLSVRHAKTIVYRGEQIVIEKAKPWTL